MRPVIYQLFVRHFSNMETHGVDWGDPGDERVRHL